MKKTLLAIVALLCAGLAIPISSFASSYGDRLGELAAEDSYEALREALPLGGPNCSQIVEISLP